MSAQNIRAGRAFVEVTADMSPLKMSLAKGQAALKEWGSSLSGIASNLSTVWAAFTGSAIVAGIAASVKQFANVGSELNDMSQRTGASAAQLQTWIFAAKQTGASAADLETAFRKMAKNGVSAADFEELGRSIASNTDPTERAAQALEHFGKSGTKLLPMFAELNSLKAAAAAIGPTLTDEDVRNADALGDAFSALVEASSRALQQIGRVFGPALQTMLETTIGIIAEFADMVRDIGNGEDWLTTAGNFMWKLETLSGRQEMGRRGAMAIGSFRGAASASEEEAMAEAEERSVEAMMKRQDIGKSIEAGERRRLALIREQETAHERFLRKQQEILSAIAEANRNRVLGFISQEQAAAERRGLETALTRLRQAERERLQDEMNKNRKEMPQFALMFRQSSRGTFSAAGASLLGRGGEASQIERQQLAELKGIRKAVEGFEGPRFG